MLIVLCGIDGSGKTTLGERLSASLSKELLDSGHSSQVLFTKLIGNGSAFVRYFKLLVQIDPNFDERSQNYAFAFERVRTADETLGELLRTHYAVVLDRYVHCDIAMSRAHGREESMFYTVLKHVPLPDLGFIIDVPAEVAMQRINDRQIPPWVFNENESLLRQGRLEYLRLAEEFGFEVIDASGTPENALDQMMRCIRQRGFYPAPVEI